MEKTFIRRGCTCRRSIIFIPHIPHALSQFPSIKILELLFSLCNYCLSFQMDLVDMRNKSNFQFLQPQVAGIKISGQNSLVNATRCLPLSLSLFGPLSGLRVLKTLKCSKKHEFFMYFWLRARQVSLKGVASSLVAVVCFASGLDPFRSLSLSLALWQQKASYLKCR